MPDHIHFFVAIPPKYRVSEFVRYLKGKSSLMVFDRHANLILVLVKWFDNHFIAPKARQELMRRDFIIFFFENNGIDNAARRCLLNKTIRFIKN